MSTSTLPRRTFLQQSAWAGLAAACAPLPTALAAGTGGAGRTAGTDAAALGHWIDGDAGLPAYAYHGALPASARNLKGKDAMLPDDPLFILGNHRITVFAHVSGIVQLMTGERAWARANAAPDRINYGANAATLRTGAGHGNAAPGRDDRHYELAGMASLAADPQRCERRFGTGFAQYRFQLEDNLECSRVLSVRPSGKPGEGDAALLVSITLHNRSATALPYIHEESYANNYTLAGEQKRVPDQRRATYTAQLRKLNDVTVLADYTVRLNRFLIAPHRDQASPIDIAPASVFLHMPRPPAGVQVGVGSSDQATLRARFSGTLAPGASVTLEYVVGFAGDAATLTARLRKLLAAKSAAAGMTGRFGAEWARQLPRFDDEQDAALRSEMRWNAYVLEAMATYSAYFGETYVPQGMVYTYQDGDNIANRDNFQAVLPLCQSNPALAKSALRYALKHTTEQGEIKRGTSGYGYSEPSIYKESDEQLYAMMAVGEYLRVTRDYALLDERIAYFPCELRREATVATLLQRHFIYLRDVVGVGEHGLIRLLNSDWSDSFLHKYSPNVTEWCAESVLNSAMALAVLPRLLSGLDAARRPALRPYSAALREYHAGLLSAFLRDFGTRSYAARAYLNDGNPSYGLDIVCLEPQGFVLQIPELPAARRQQIYNAVKAAVFAPEKVGFRIREKPLGGSGEGEDGAIWPALQGQLVAAMAAFDPAEARRILAASSFRNFADRYPDFWTGRWTHSDSYGSTLSEREGLFQWWEGEPKRTFQGYCSHAHAWPLYCYYLVREAEAGRTPG